MPGVPVILSTFFFSLNIPLFKFLTSSFEYLLVLLVQVMLSSFLCPEDAPNTLWAGSLTNTAVLSQSSGNTCLTPKACLNSSLKFEQHSSLFNFHHFILAYCFIRFLVFISKAILQPTVWWCIATLSPDTTLQSFSDCTFCIVGSPSCDYLSSLLHVTLCSFLFLKYVFTTAISILLVDCSSTFPSLTPYLPHVPLY